ncbi:RNA-directed DNA polymerase, eukaryota, reverse transcriptase zinc-binding domain protein [Tanacetum coccineum]
MTRLETFRLKSMWGNYNFDFTCSMASGRSGGLISTWDLNSFIKDDIWCDDAFIIVKRHWRNTVGDCYMINIYGPQNSLVKAILWNRIGDFMHQHAEVAEALPDVRVTAIDRLWSVVKTELPKLEEHKQWHSETKTYDRVTKHDNLQLIKSIEEKIEAGSANDDDRDSRIKLLQEVDNLDTFESFDLFQKAHPSQIKEEFLTFLKEKFKDHDLNVNFPLFSNSSGLRALDRDSLETPVSLDEVKNMVWDCGSSNAPGPDGFKCRSWITAYLSSSRASVLVNVSPTLEFSIKRGLRQGDPLSPFLFILVMEGLHNALSIIVSSVLIRGVTFGSPEVTISHLFYGDDVIITTEWNANDLDNILRVLQVFYLALGLKINIQKSNVNGIGVLNVDVSSMASNFGCASGSFPFTYLELPISSNMSLTSSWQGLLDMF